MDYTKKQNISGILLFMDFEKAFDSTDWGFMLKCLDVFGFGPNFKGWVETFYTNISSCIEQFSFECRKTKTKVITLTNHNSRKQSYEPIRARSKYMSPVPSAGKRVRVNHDWFWFYF